MIVASLPAARIIVAKYATSVLELTIGSSRRTESQTLPSHKNKPISTSNSSNSSSWNRFGRRLKLPMLSFGGSGLMTSNWRELHTSENPHYELSPSSMLPIERDNGNSTSQKKLIDEGERREKEDTI